MLATAGPGFLGCLGHGDWAARSELTAVVDDAGNAVRLDTGTGNAPRVAAGWAHSACVLEGRALVWGRRLEPPTSALRLARLDGFVPLFARLVNSTAVLLDTSKDLALRPEAVDIPGRATAVACGAGVTAIVTEDGGLFTFGANTFGQCGSADFSEAQPFPRRVVFEGAEKSAPRITDVALGFRHGLALDDQGGLHAWGKNDNGQLGCGDRDTKPVAVPLDVEPCVAIGCGLAHSAALTKTGRLLVWGKMRDPHTSSPNKVAINGPDVYGDALSPVFAPGVRGKTFSALATSNFHAAVADTDGRVFVAGLEAGSREMVHAPREVALPAGRWRLRSGVDAIALIGDDEVRKPNLVPGLTGETTLVYESAVADVALGWKHAVAAATSTVAFDAPAEPG